MELVANIWPIVDERSGMIQRFAARAYAMEANEATIAATLKTLAGSDFMIARQFPIPREISLVTPHGTLEGCVTVDLFNRNQTDIIESALLDLQSERQALLGIGFDSKSTAFYKQVDVVFPNQPFVAVTFVIEDQAGNLRVHGE